MKFISRSRPITLVLSPEAAALEVDTEDVVNVEHTKTRSYVAGSYLRQRIVDSDVALTDISASPVADLSDPDFIDRVANDVGVLRADGAGVSDIRVFDFRTQATTETNVMTGWVPGSASGVVWAEMSSLMVPGASKNIYNSSTWSSGLSRNESCWANDYDFSGVPIKHLSGGFFGGGVLITPRHVYATHHYTGHADQTSFTFLRANGSQVTIAVAGQCESDNPGIGRLSNNYVKQDIHVYALAEDVPEDVTFYAIPDNSTAVGVSWIMPGQAFAQPHIFPPMVWVTPQRQALVTYTHADEAFTHVIGFAENDTIGGTNYTALTAIVAATAAWGTVPAPLIASEWRRDVVAGDSGSPLFFTIDGQLVLAGLLSVVEPLPPYPHLTAQVHVLNENVLNACIASADADAGVTTGYTVTTVATPAP